VPTGVWLIRSRIESLRLEDHLCDLVTRLEPSADAVAQVAAEVEHAEVFCVWMTDSVLGAGRRCPRGASGASPGWASHSPSTSTSSATTGSERAIVTPFIEGF
jgi:hypothetical protein